MIDFNNPVTILSGNEYLPKPGITFAQQVFEFFVSQGGKADSPWGEVLLDMKGIQSDKAHGIGRIKAASFAAIKDVLENGSIILPLDYYAIHSKKQMIGMMAAPLTEKNPEIAASSLVCGSKAASPQSLGSITKILLRLLIYKSSLTDF